MQIKLNLIPLFSSKMELTTAQNLNELIARFSIGIIISTIFYLIVSVLPNKIKSRSTMKIIQPRLDSICNDINKSLLYLLNKNRTVKIQSLKNLSASEFVNIQGLKNKPKNFKYQFTRDDKNWTTVTSGTITDFQHFFHHKKSVQGKVDEIFSLPNITNLNDAILDNLAKLRDSTFFGSIYAYEKFGEQISIDDLGNEVYEYYSEFNKLSKYCSIEKIRIEE